MDFGAPNRSVRCPEKITAANVLTMAAEIIVPASDSLPPWALSIIANKNVVPYDTDNK